MLSSWRKNIRKCVLWWRDDTLLHLAPLMRPCTAEAEMSATRGCRLYKARRTLYELNTRIWTASISSREKTRGNFSPCPSARPPAAYWDDYSARLLHQITVTPRTPPDGHTRTHTHIRHTETPGISFSQLLTLIAYLAFLTILLSLTGSSHVNEFWVTRTQHRGNGTFGVKEVGAL